MENKINNLQDIFINLITNIDEDIKWNFHFENLEPSSCSLEKHNKILLHRIVQAHNYKSLNLMKSLEKKKTSNELLKKLQNLIYQLLHKSPGQIKSKFAAKKKKKGKDWPVEYSNEGPLSIFRSLFHYFLPSGGSAAAFNRRIFSVKFVPG